MARLVSWFLYQAKAEPVQVPAAVPDLAWAPVYPEIEPGRSVRLSAAVLAGAFFFVGTPVAPIAGEVAAWKPGYPDQIDRLTVRAADQRAAFSPDFLPVADLRWQAVYPDQIDRAIVRASDQRPTFAPDFLPLADLRWEPEYPGRLDRREATPWLWPVLAFEGGPVIPVTDLRWKAIYPDWLARLLTPPSAQFLALDPFPRPAEALTVEWLPRYPDWLAHLPVQPSGSVEPPFSVRPLGHVGWLGVYPDFVLRRHSAPWLWPWLWLDAFPRPTADVGWLSAYPEQVRALGRVREFPAFALPPFVQVTDLRWRPAYPDRLDPARRVGEFSAFTLPPFISVADLRWASVWPDRVDRLVAQPWLWPWEARDVVPIAAAAPDLSWASQYPAFLRQVVLPIGAMPVEVGPLTIPFPRVPLRITPEPRRIVLVGTIPSREQVSTGHSCRMKLVGWCRRPRSPH